MQESRKPLFARYLYLKINNNSRVCKGFSKTLISWFDKIYRHNFLWHFSLYARSISELKSNWKEVNKSIQIFLPHFLSFMIDNWNDIWTIDMHKFHHLTGAYIVVILYPSNKSSEKPQKRDMKNKTSIWTHLVYLFCTSLADITSFFFYFLPHPILRRITDNEWNENEMKKKWHFMNEKPRKTITSPCSLFSIYISSSIVKLILYQIINFFGKPVL